jgi:hypothetical protein
VLHTASRSDKRIKVGGRAALLGTIGLAAMVMMLVGTRGVQAEDFGGVDFPFGEASFADQVVGYVPTGNVTPGGGFDDPLEALGAPDGEFVALGNSEVITDGELIVEFRDNFLVDVEGIDLWIFEVGPVVEATDISISKDGVTWIELGRIDGSTSGVDIGPFVAPDDVFTFVRLRDFPDGKSSGAPFGGPDIDAIGAIGALARPDSDQDGLPDDVEALLGTDPLVADTDGDGLSDGDEVDIHLSSPVLVDTDADGLSDGDEVILGSYPFDPDTDGDGLTDGFEVDMFFDALDPLNPHLFIPDLDPDADSDGDGISDADELRDGTDPFDPFDPPLPPTMLFEGFNELRWNGPQVPIQQALAAILDLVLSVFQWSNETQEWTSFSPELPAALNTLTNFEPGELVWISVTIDTEVPDADGDFDIFGS